MEKRLSRNPQAFWIRRRQGLLVWLQTTLLLLIATGCGAPGEPSPPSPAIPVRTADLAPQQNGDAVQLTFTLPTKTVSGEPLAEPPAVEVLLGAVRSDGSPDPKSFRAVETIPGAMAGEYRTSDKIQILRRISAE